DEKKQTTAAENFARVITSRNLDNMMKSVKKSNLKHSAEFIIDNAENYQITVKIEQCSVHIRMLQVIKYMHSSHSSTALHELQEKRMYFDIKYKKYVKMQIRQF